MGKKKKKANIWPQVRMLGVPPYSCHLADHLEYSSPLCLQPWNMGESSGCGETQPGIVAHLGHLGPVQ